MDEKETTWVPELDAGYIGPEFASHYYFLEEIAEVVTTVTAQVTQLGVLTEHLQAEIQREMRELKEADAPPGP